MRICLKIFELKMMSLEGEGTRVIDKFNGEDFNTWKFKSEMGLVSVDLWDIVNESKEGPPFNIDPKVRKDY